MPIARLSDPQTSQDAAESVNGLTITRTRKIILTILATRHCHDEGLIQTFRNLPGGPIASESGIRSRRAELVAAGLVEDTGKRIRTASGRNSIIWGLAPEEQLPERCNWCGRKPCQCNEIEDERTGN
jgi:hypothetical protein